MKFFLCSDIHSFFDEWKKALDEAGYDVNNEDHCLVVLGDLLDRGDQSVECLQFIHSVPSSRKILIRGNHEDMLEEALARGFFMEHDRSNGTVKTCAQIYMSTLQNYKLTDKASIQDVIRATKNDSLLQEYLKSCVDYYETSLYVFVHGWIPYHWNDIEDWRDGNWAEARWDNGMQAWNQGFVIPDKTICCGHWNASYGHSELDGKGSQYGDDADHSPFIAPGIIAIDACTALSHKVNVVVVEDF